MSSNSTVSSPAPKRFKRSKRSLLAPLIITPKEDSAVTTVVDQTQIPEPNSEIDNLEMEALPDPRLDEEIIEEMETQSQGDNDNSGILGNQSSASHDNSGALDNRSVSVPHDNTGSSDDHSNYVPHDNSGVPDDRSDTQPLVTFELVNQPNREYSEKFLRHTVKAEFKFNHNLMDLKDIPPINDDLDNAFEAALKSLLKDVQSDSKVSVSIANEKLVKNIYLPPVDVSDFKKENFLNTIAMVYQSNKEFVLDGALKVTVYILDKLQGSGRTSCLPQTYEDKCANKTSILTIKNTDESCGLRALFVGKTFIDMCPSLEATDEWRRFYNNRKNTVTLGARQLAMQFGLSMQKRLTIDEIATKIQPVWSGQYQIFIIDVNSRELLFKGPNDCTKHIYLLWSKDKNNNGHYDVIKKIWSLYNQSKWCQNCFKFFKLSVNHHCPNGCYICRSPQRCIEDQTKRDCVECGRSFLNQNCYETHINNSLCKELHFCNECEVTYRVVKKHPHECDVYLCRACKERYSEMPHYCKLKTLSSEKLVEDDQVPKIINIFDIESMLITEDKSDKHEPNLVCSMTVCDQCTDEKLKNPNYNCVFCGILYQKFEGDQCVSSFVTHVCDFLAQKAHSMGGHVLSIAHNFSGYDGAFVFKNLLDQQMQNIRPILNGSKLMKIDVGNVRFLDSLLFFQLPLSKLPSAFGIPDISKGYFPYHINKPENQNMSDCPLSDINEKSYGIETMSESNVKSFREWYSLQVNSGTVFQFWPELEKYCKNDVSILLQAVISFKKYFKQLTNLDPVTRCFTLPSVGLEDFKAHHLEEDSIIVTPVNGFGSKRNKSAKETAYIDYQEFKVFGYTIVRDYKIGPYRADGMYCKPHVDNGHTYTKVAFFFDGCYFHGCNKCRVGESEAQKQKRENRERYFKKRNIFLIVEKECHFDDFYAKSLDLNIRKFIKQRLTFHRIINKNDFHVYPRKSLHGGRTNNIKFYAKADENVSLHYFDFTSLYPWVLKNHSFPMKNPITVYDHKLSSGHSIKDYKGLISAKVLPPRRLRFPVLPFNCNNKLMFPLCRTCAIEQNHSECRHTIKERQFTGVFTSAELHKAVDRGYKIRAVYEITHFLDWSDSVFKAYINKWFKVKAEASGWPKNVNTDEEKDAWIAEMKRKEEIDIEKDKVAYNPGLRFIAKLMLNSLWGKLAQRPNRPQTKIVKNYSELWQLFNDERIEILGEYTIDDMILVNYRFINDSLAPAGQTCSAIASFVTAYARLKLLDEIEKIENDNPGSVIYFDTDSIVFSWKEGCYKPFVGNYLGEMTDEISDEYGLGSELCAFYTTGPKSYCTKVLKRKTGSVDEFVYKMKAKGLTQNYGAKDTLNPVTIMKHAVFKAMEKQCEPVFVPQCQFRRHPKQGFTVTTDHIKKVFKNTSNKRRIIGNDTVPFGFLTTKHTPINWDRINEMSCVKWNEQGNNVFKSCGDVKCRKCVKRLGECHDDECDHPDCRRRYHFHRADY